MIAVGATETSTFASWCIDHTTPLDPALIPVGLPPQDVTLELLGDDGAAVGPGEIGEIFVTSPTLAAGYWRDEALTQARFGPSTKFPGKTRFRTGDFGRFLPNGMLEFIGRRDRQVKIRGNTVNLGEVEAVLAGCHDVAEASVIARQRADETTLAAYYAPMAGSAIAEERFAALVPLASVGADAADAFLHDGGLAPAAERQGRPGRTCRARRATTAPGAAGIDA